MTQQCVVSLGEKKENVNLIVLNLGLKYLWEVFTRSILVLPFFQIVTTSDVSLIDVSFLVQFNEHGTAAHKFEQRCQAGQDLDYHSFSVTVILPAKRFSRKSNVTGFIGDSILLYCQGLNCVSTTLKGTRALLVNCKTYWYMQCLRDPDVQWVYRDIPNQRIIFITLSVKQLIRNYCL